MRTIRTMIWLRPLPFKISVPKRRSPQRNTPVEACVPICKPFQKKSEKVPASGHSGLKSKISEKMLFQPRYTSPMHKICFALNKEKDVVICSGIEWWWGRSGRSGRWFDYTLYLSRFPFPKCGHHSGTPLLKPVCRFVSLFRRNRKSTSRNILRA